MTKQKMKVHLINPNKIDENRSYLYFEADDNARHRFKSNIRNGIADEKVYTISTDYVQLNTNTEWVYYDVHKVIGETGLYMLVESNNFENDEPIAAVYSKKEVLVRMENMNCTADVERIETIG